MEKLADKNFEETIKIRYSEMDYGLVLKPSCLLQFLQDLASDNAEALGFGYSFVTANNLGWYLLKYRIEFENYPVNVGNLTIKTRPRGYNKLFAFRDFEIYNGDTLLGRAASTWSLVDINSKSIIPMEPIFKGNSNMPPFQKCEGDLSYEKIKPLSRVDIQKTYEIRFDDIDVNRHANNANYIIWAFEPLEFDFRSNKILKTLDIVFKKEVKYGTSVISCVEINENKTTHVLKSLDTEEDLCYICAQWKER